MEILGVIVAGVLIIGLLGKLLAPGDKDNIPLWLTVLCGVVGVVAASYSQPRSGSTRRTHRLDPLDHQHRRRSRRRDHRGHPNRTPDPTPRHGTAVNKARDIAADARRCHLLAT